MYSDILEWNIEVSLNDWFKFTTVLQRLRDKKGQGYTNQEEYILLYCPMSKEQNYKMIPKKDGFTIDLLENCMMLNHEGTWIPFMAQFFKGTIKVRDEEDELWCVRFRGDGLYSYNQGVIQYVQKTLWTPDGTKEFIDKLMKDD